MTEEIKRYENLAIIIKTVVENYSLSTSNFRSLFEQKIPGSINTGECKYTDDELRKLIEITRSIRVTIFDNIDKNILAIEHQADRILCQRRSKERDQKATKAKVEINKTSPIGTARTFNKPEPKSKLEELLEMMKKASPEQLNQAFNNVKK